MVESSQARKCVADNIARTNSISIKSLNMIKLFNVVVTILLHVALDLGLEVP